MSSIKVIVWGENWHERHQQEVAAIYPEGLHSTIAEAIVSLSGANLTVSTATLDEPDCGLSEAVLSDTDVLVWWGHVLHDEVTDELVERMYDRVLAGMGLVVLHSGAQSKIFKKLMGTSCTFRYRSDSEREVVWTVDPTHPIVEGVPQPIVIPVNEMYGEYFDVPRPDDVIFISSFAGGEVFRSGLTFRRGLGRIFFFAPGDQHYPIYHHPDVQRVIANGVGWVAPKRSVGSMPEGNEYKRGEFDVPVPK